MAYSQLSAARKNARATAENTAIGANCLIRIYTGAQPANPDAAATGTLLATLTGNASGFGTVSGAVITANAISQGTAVATGLAGWARVSTSGGTAWGDLDVGTSNASVIMNTTSISSGGPVQITSMTVTEVANNV